MYEELREMMGVVDVGVDICPLSLWVYLLYVPSSVQYSVGFWFVTGETCKNVRGSRNSNWKIATGGSRNWGLALMGGNNVVETF